MESFQEFALLARLTRGMTRWLRAPIPGKGADHQLRTTGGNSTGVAFMSPELSGKRLALMAEVVPNLSRAAILWDPSYSEHDYRGDNGFIVPAYRPMQRTVVGKEQRRSIVLILHETGKPASGFETNWIPKGVCTD